MSDWFNPPVDRRPRCPFCGERAVGRGLEPATTGMPAGTVARFECDTCRWAVLLTEAALKHNHGGVPMPHTPGEGW